MIKQPNPNKLIKLNQYVKKEIDKRIEVYFASKIAAAAQIDPNYRQLLEAMQQFMLRGGKRLRPTLMVLGYQAAGGTELPLALDAALALEVFHAFVLMHDDVMDGDTRRYGGPNMTGVYLRRYQRVLKPEAARRTAESMAILAGELNEAFSFEIMSKLNMPADVVLALIGHLQKVLFETGGGQQLDVIAPTRKSINPKIIEKINYYKTAQYTITSPLQFGVIAAQQSSELQAGFGAFGEQLGVAFQLKDDLLGMFGSTRQTGKPVGADLREGKQTLLMYYAKKLSNSVQWRVIESRLGKPNLTIDDIKTVRKILRECGADAKVAVTAKEHLLKAVEQIDALQLNQEVADLLRAFAYHCVERKK